MYGSGPFLLLQGKIHNQINPYQYCNIFSPTKPTPKFSHTNILI